MRFNLCGNNTNGCGLQQDYEILKSRLEALGHTVFPVQYGKEQPIEKVDVNVFLELVMPQVFAYAPEQWCVPNPEWWLPNLWGRHTSRVNRFLCKTPDCLRVFESTSSGRAVYMPFRSQDMLDEGVVAARGFLHMAGRSQTKNTPAIIEAWRRSLVPAPLTLVTSNAEFLKAAAGIRNVSCVERATEEEKRALLNGHLFHLCPSQYEGWGHYLHEALSVGAVIVTTNAAPMNGFPGMDARLLVASFRKMPHGVAHLHTVRPEDVAEAAIRALSMDDAEINGIRDGARSAYEAELVAFNEASEKIFGRVADGVDVRSEASGVGTRS